MCQLIFQKTDQQEKLAALLLIVIIFLASCLYWPGLGGIFLLDDIPNLSPLGENGGIKDLNGILRYLSDQSAGPLGRPISYLTFIANSTTWPTDPWVFKYTNLMLHLLTGILICWFVFRLARFLDITEGQAALWAVASGSLWMLHPLNVSTVLYVVQRMTILSTLFTVIGLLLYLYGRERVSWAPLQGYLWMSIGIVLGGLLSILSKENGILLPLYILIVEWTLLKPFGYASPPHWRIWSIVFLYFPLITVAIYLILRWPDFLEIYRITRPFTFAERLLTESRILFDYLSQIFIPRLHGSGLLHDDYSVSYSLIEPLSTLAAIVGCGILLGGSALIRHKKLRILQFSIFWFFAGHLLESTFLPLELYFEHRNYLPMLGPLIGLIYYIKFSSVKIKKFLVLSLVSFLIISSAITWTSARTWGDGVILAATWAHENPSSIRSQQFVADFYLKAGNLNQAIVQLETALNYHPDDAGIIMQIIQLSCYKKNFDRFEFERHVSRIRKGDYNTVALDALTRIVEMYKTMDCSWLTSSDLHDIIDAILNNPKFSSLPSTAAAFFYIKGQVYAYDKQLTSAIEALEQAFERNPNVDIVLYQVELLVSACLFDEALNFIRKARLVDNDSRWLRRGLRRSVIQRWEENIQLLKQINTCSDRNSNDSIR